VIQVALLVVQLQCLVNGLCSLLGSAGQVEHFSQVHQRVPCPSSQSAVGVWEALHHRLLDWLGDDGQVDWSRAAID
jgi:hypothetical protein